MGTEDRTRRWEHAAAWVAAALVAGAVVVALVVALPPTLANLASARSDGITPVDLTGSAGTVEVVVPVDWIVTREDAGRVVARTPDGMLEAHLAVVDAPPDAALDAPSDAGEVRQELLASGATAVHADLPEGLVAAVGSVGSAPSVRIVVEVADPARAGEYRPVMAELLEGVRA